MRIIGAITIWLSVTAGVAAIILLAVLNGGPMEALA